MEKIKGIPAAPGVAIGKAFLHKAKYYAPEQYSIEDTSQETKLLEIALTTAEEELQQIFEATLKSAGKEVAEIFNAHRMMLRDPELIESVKKLIRKENINASAAYYEASESYAKTIENLTDKYLSERAADVRDVAVRVIRVLGNEKETNTLLSIPSIVFAEDLAPSDTVQYDRDKLLGFFTKLGGATSHTAILSRALGIPAIVGAESMPENLIGDQIYILDGTNGTLIIDPDESTILNYQSIRNDSGKKYSLEKKAALEVANTQDGKSVTVLANIGNLADAIIALENGAEGTGLFRTEISYLEQADVPNEDTLFEIYKGIFETFGDYPVIVRTLDVGGDKEIPHLGLPKESNPFLGNRGIRLCLSRPDLFKPQLRAILRAGANSNLSIMFPMIAIVQEVIDARKMLEECRSELQAEKVLHNNDPKIGIMIEIPAAAICADLFAKEVDFLSIGTNDLSQYTMAADRTNANVAYLGETLSPAILRIISGVIDKGHNAGIPVGMCGEMASDPLAIPILLGMGLDEFSVNPLSVPQTKAILRKWDSSRAALLTKEAAKLDNSDGIKDLIGKWNPT